LKNEERMKNGGKPSRICLEKHLGSVTEAPWLRFSSRKQFFSLKIAEMHSQGDQGPLVEIRYGSTSAWISSKSNPASRNSLEGPIQNFKIAICTPILISSPPSFVIYEKLRKPIVLDFILSFSSFSPILSKICLFRVKGILRKHYECPGSPFFNKTGEVVCTCHTLISSGDLCLVVCNLCFVILRCLTPIIRQFVKFRDVPEIKRKY